VTLTLRVENGIVSGYVDYPEFGCGGSVASESIDHQTLWLQETITYGGGPCAPNGRVSVVLQSNDTAAWAWYQGTTRATALLTLDT
jgi:hypothetical protein